MKKIISLSVLLFVALTAFCQLQSPEQFLGYPVGSRFTPHHKIVSYFEYVASQAPQTVKLIKYGETNELRPLYLAFISTSDHIANLEEIRINNLRLANMAKDKRVASEDAPAIVWLSYNVHGNEASSSEAAMLTLFALMDAKNSETQKYLQNTVVVIDPCLNPDGRDRYVNWYNTVVGKKYNPDLGAREHREPWPGGRSNHYNYDLNRDWAWQTQVESRQRLQQYNQWLPQVHVDFHEQGINSPYYFAPAAQPYHEVLTPFQREFQRTIGKNIAKAFDRNNWFYFTNEVFDLFYPSYGDTYPLYNGSIGMTFEQAGSGAAGLAALTNEGDTLTLYDRAIHHFTSGMATIQTASENARKLISEFHTFFNNASAGISGENRTYVIKNNPADRQRIEALIQLLDQNGIMYGSASGSAKGYNYLNGKDEAFSISKNDLVIPTTQPKGVMVRVLFEPASKLTDSVTYDITAWSIPYAYGLTAFATRQNLAIGTPDVFPDFTNNVPSDTYANIIDWGGVSSAKAVSALLNKGVRMRFSQSPFTINGQNFNRGSVIITRKGNEKFGDRFWNMVFEICNANKILLRPVATGMVDKGYDFGSSNISYLKPVKVALLTGEGISSLAAGEIWDFFDNTLAYPVTLVNSQDFDNLDWSKFDVIILPDGRYRFLNNKESAAGLEEWIRKGGKLIAVENAVAQLSKLSWSDLKEKADSSKKDTTAKNPYELIKPYENRERDYVSSNIPGAIFKVNIDNTHPLMFGYPDYYYTLKLDKNVYSFMKDGWNTGILKKNSLVSGYVGNRIESEFRDGLLFGVQDLGRGSITYLADDVLFRNFWESGKLMFCNAVFFVGE